MKVVLVLFIRLVLSRDIGDVKIGFILFLFFVLFWVNGILSHAHYREY